jgi:hypothetical protein
MKIVSIITALVCLFVLCGCNEEESLTITAGTFTVPASPTYGGDMDLRRAKLNMNLKPDSPYDAKHSAVIAGSFETTAITRFTPSTRITLVGRVTDAKGFGAQASGVVAPTKVNKRGTRMIAKMRKYSTVTSPHHSGNPVTRIFQMSYNERQGSVKWMLSVTPKNVGVDNIGWMQYYDLLQSLFGSGKSSDTYNGGLDMTVTGYSDKLQMMVTETHTISGPVGFAAKNGRLKIGEVK